MSRLPRMPVSSFVIRLWSEEKKKIPPKQLFPALAKAFFFLIHVSALTFPIRKCQWLKFMGTFCHFFFFLI